MQDLVLMLDLLRLPLRLRAGARTPKFRGGAEEIGAARKQRLRRYRCARFAKNSRLNRYVDPRSFGSVVRLSHCSRGSR